eukprot:COSAG06_NODE_53915_length_297_cov_1.015152_1_plen_33_part_01
MRERRILPPAALSSCSEEQVSAVDSTPAERLEG